MSPGLQQLLNQVADAEVLQLDYFPEEWSLDLRSDEVPLAHTLGQREDEDELTGIVNGNRFPHLALHGCTANLQKAGVPEESGHYRPISIASDETKAWPMTRGEESPIPAPRIWRVTTPPPLKTYSRGRVCM